MTEITVPSTDVEVSPREPEKLVIPAGAVMWLLMKAFQSPEGDAWMRGFITAHGEPSWIVNNQWGIKADAAEIVRAERTNGVAR
jgi:hypothetical protein